MKVNRTGTPRKLGTYYVLRLSCPVGQGVPSLLAEARVKDKINVFQNNVCSYCRNKVLKDEGIESRLLK